MQLVGEYNSSGALTTRHVPGPGLDQPVATYSGGARFQQIADERGSIIGVADAAGSVNINRYDEYGAPSAANRFQYTGQAWMAPGIYNYRARAYAPALGRFLQTDPIGYSAGLNIYGYVSGDPVNLIDPFGLCGTDAPGDRASSPVPIQAPDSKTTPPNVPGPAFTLVSGRPVGGPSSRGGTSIGAVLAGST